MTQIKSNYLRILRVLFNQMISSLLFFFSHIIHESWFSLYDSPHLYFKEHLKFFQLSQDLDGISLKSTCELC